MHVVTGLEWLFTFIFVYISIKNLESNRYQLRNLTLVTEGHKLSEAETMETHLRRVGSYDVSEKFLKRN